MTKDALDDILAARMHNIPRSFIREILKVTNEPDMLSFAGGLPNPELFPVEEIKAACAKVFEVNGPNILQYSTTEGVAGLRHVIAARYAARGLKNIDPDRILITSGSQQALDLLAKIMIDKGDGVIIEEPAYLGAIQALSIYEPDITAIPLHDEGMDTDALKKALAKKKAKMMYIVPNFQNPTGITYSEENRKAIAEAISSTSTFIIEDDPYGELRFSGKNEPSFFSLAPENTILLGSFSKTVVPAFRLGWAVVPEKLMDKLVVAKQATDLHTNSFAQYVMYQYLTDNDNAEHIKKIVARYSAQKNAMHEAILEYFPQSVSCTNPQGGMFLWGELPDDISSMKLFDLAVKNKICIVPGHPFYIGGKDVSSFRLSFSCIDEATIRKGIQTLSQSIKELCGC